MRRGPCTLVPSRALGLDDGQPPGKAELLEPAHEGVGEAHDGEPRPVGRDVGEAEPPPTP